MLKLIAALETLMQQLTAYYDRNPEVLETMPPAEEWAKACENAEIVLADAKANFQAHIDKVSEVYEAMKDKLTDMGAFGMPGMDELFTLAQQLRDLACVEYDSDEWKIVQEIRLPLS